MTHSPSGLSGGVETPSRVARWWDTVISEAVSARGEARRNVLGYIIVADVGVPAMLASLDGDSAVGVSSRQVGRKVEEDELGLERGVFGSA